MTIPMIILIYLVGNAALNMCWFYMNAKFVRQERRFWKVSGTLLSYPQQYLVPIWLVCGCLTAIALLRLVASWIRLVFFMFFP